MAKSVKKKSVTAQPHVSEDTLEQIKKFHPVIANSNGKGGVGKTTFTSHEAWYCSEVLGLKTLVIDFDIDMHISKVFFGEEFDLSDYASSSDLFSNIEIAKPLLQHPDNEKLFFIPSDFDLEKIGNRDDEDDVSVFPYFHVQSLRERFDIILIDCPPGKGQYRNAGMLASNLTVLITEMSGISFSAVSSAIKITDQMVSLLNEHNPDMQFQYPAYLIVPNKFKGSRKEHRDALSDLKASQLKISTELRDFGPIETSINVRRPVWTFKDGNARSAAKNFKEVIINILSASVEVTK
ncbi:chromosome partitioning protein [Rahnella inusitata]|nr:chromosome partitioning protein [Rahnella inusitata]